MTEQEFLYFLGQRVREFRKKAKMTQGELAQKTGLAQSNISSFENGQEGIKGVTRIKRLVEATGHTMADLFTFDTLPEKKTKQSPSLSKGSLMISLGSSL